MPLPASSSLPPSTTTLPRSTGDVASADPRDEATIRSRRRQRCDTASVSLVRQLRSFYERRIALPVDHDALVLDVGSGDKPHWRADVLLDRYVGAEHGVQRSGRAAARLPRPLFDADAADMPFADRVFDYVVCSHLLEHVLDPGGVIDEMVRVARAGYIEVPRITSAKIADFPSHLWWCDVVDGELVFTAKDTAQFDDDIQRFVGQPDVERDLQRLFDRNFDQCIVRYPWAGSVLYRVIGTPSPALVASIASAGGGGHHRSFESMVSRLLTAVLTLPRRGRRPAPPTLNRLVKPSMRRHPDVVLEPGLVTGLGTGREAGADQKGRDSSAQGTEHAPAQEPG